MFIVESKLFDSRLIRILVILFLSLFVETRASAFTTIPLVGCPENELDNGVSKTPSNASAIKTDLSPAVANKLAIYKSATQTLVGPRGWSCRGTAGQYFVELDLQSSNLGGAKVYEEKLVYTVAFKPSVDAQLIAYAKRYFPKFFAKYSATIFSPGWVTEADLPSLPEFPSDRIYYITPVLTLFETPGGHIGIGTKLLNTSLDPINGFLSLITGSEGEKPVCDMAELALDLPKQYFQLVPAIEQAVLKDIPTDCDY